MTQLVVDAEIPHTKNPELSSSGHYVIDDVTNRRRVPSGRRETAFQWIEKRFRDDLSRRLRDLRVQVEESQGRVTRYSGRPGSMPTIAVKPSTSAWTLIRPPRRRCVSYQSVTQAVNLLTILSPRPVSYSLPQTCQRTLSGVTSLTDNHVTSAEVAVSRTSVTSSTSGLSDVFGESVHTVSESDLSTANVGGVADVIDDYSKSDQPEVEQRICNRHDNVEEPAEFATSVSHNDQDIGECHTESRASLVARIEIEDRTGRLHDDAENPAIEKLLQQSSEDLCATTRSGNRSPLYVSNMQQHKPEMACDVDVVSGLLLSHVGTGSSLDERRRSPPEETTFDNDVDSRSDTDDSAVADDVDCELQPVNHDRCELSTDTGAADAAADNTTSSASEMNSSLTTLHSLQHLRLDSLPDSITPHDVTDEQGHVILSSARLLERLTATLNALTVDCRQTGARNHGNDVEVTTERHDVSAAASVSDTNVHYSNMTNEARREISNIVLKDPVVDTDVQDVENVITSQRLNTDVECLTRSPMSDTTVTESSFDCSLRIQHQTDDKQCSNETVETTTIDVILHKGPLGLGFCIDGGLDSPEGPAPITVKRLFKGDTAAKGVLCPGDELLKVNDISFVGLNHFHAWTLLKRLPEGPVYLTIRRHSNQSVMMHRRRRSLSVISPK